LANWTTTFVVSEPGLSGVYLGWSASGETSAYSNYNANAIATVASSMSLNGASLVSDTARSECHTTTSDCSRNGPLASSKTFVFENSPSVGEQYSIVGSLSATTHAFGAGVRGGGGFWNSPVDDHSFSLPRLSVDSILTVPQRIVAGPGGVFLAPHLFSGIGAYLSSAGNKALTVKGADFRIYEHDRGEGNADDLVGSYSFNFVGGPDEFSVGPGQSLYNFFNTPVTLSPAMLNALVDTAMDADHLDLVVEGVPLRGRSWLCQQGSLLHCARASQCPAGDVWPGRIEVRRAAIQR
jgi:hypothetical protein